MAKQSSDPRPARELTDAELEAELERLGKEWELINDPNNSLTDDERELARHRHAERGLEVEREWNRRNP